MLPAPAAPEGARLHHGTRVPYRERRAGVETRMAEPAREKKHHEQHRVLAIRGKSYCNSACVFCIEKFTTYHPVAPKSDETRQLIVAGAGKYNMLFFMNGEPSVHP